MFVLQWRTFILSSDQKRFYGYNPRGAKEIQWRTQNRCDKPYLQRWVQKDQQCSCTDADQTTPTHASDLSSVAQFPIGTGVRTKNTEPRSSRFGGWRYFVWWLRQRREKENGLVISDGKIYFRLLSGHWLILVQQTRCFHVYSNRFHKRWRWFFTNFLFLHSINFINNIYFNQ